MRVVLTDETARCPRSLYSDIDDNAVRSCTIYPLYIYMDIYVYIHIYRSGSSKRKMVSYLEAILILRSCRQSIMITRSIPENINEDSSAHPLPPRPKDEKSLYKKMLTPQCSVKKGLHI